MINKALFILFFVMSLAQAGDGLGMGGGPPAHIISPVTRPFIPRDSIVVPVSGRLILPESPSIVSEGVVCEEADSGYHPYSLSSQALKRWPLSENADCMEPLKDFSIKLSLARAPLALSFATFIDGLEKHLSGLSLKWKSCGSNCNAGVEETATCKSPTVLLKRVTQIPNLEHFVLNQMLWDKISATQPRVCAATVVDLWLSSHISESSKRVGIVNDFFSAKFHANTESSVQCFDPTAATLPFHSFDGQIQEILHRIR